MTSLEFAENRLGVDIDPEEMIKRIERGESFESLRKRPDIRPSRSVDCAGDLKQRPGSLEPK